MKKFTFGGLTLEINFSKENIKIRMEAITS